MATRKSEFDKLMDDMEDKHSKRINAIMITAEDEEFGVLYHKMLEYSKPKLQRSEVIEETKEQKITIEHVYKENTEKDSE